MATLKLFRRRYCVTVSDNWTPLRVFWTLEGAKRFYRKHRAYANIYKRNNVMWEWVCGARDNDRRKEK